MNKRACERLILIGIFPPIFGSRRAGEGQAAGRAGRRTGQDIAPERKGERCSRVSRGNGHIIIYFIIFYYLQYEKNGGGRLPPQRTRKVPKERYRKNKNRVKATTATTASESMVYI